MTTFTSLIPDIKKIILGYLNYEETSRILNSDLRVSLFEISSIEDACDIINHKFVMEKFFSNFIHNAIYSEIVRRVIWQYDRIFLSNGKINMEIIKKCKSEINKYKKQIMFEKFSKQTEDLNLENISVDEVKPILQQKLRHIQDHRILEHIVEIMKYVFVNNWFLFHGEILRFFHSILPKKDRKNDSPPNFYAFYPKNSFLKGSLIVYSIETVGNRKRKIKPRHVLFPPLNETNHLRENSPIFTREFIKDESLSMAKDIGINITEKISSEIKNHMIKNNVE
jgi:hypothetical protein